jgi:anaerobic magnesium-protoporphyrin IX monomethyl ester cyclase
MKITLISTSTFPSDQGIRTISSVLKKAGHQITLIFMTASEDYSKIYSRDELRQLARLAKGSEMIGINSFASTAKRAVQIINFLRPLGIPIVWGGIHATISPQECIKSCDLVCIGEAEETVVELAKALEKGKSIDKIKNLWIRRGEKIIKNNVRPLVDDLDTIPFPDFEIENHHILEKSLIRKFEERDLTGQIFFLTGRGCPYGCDYCSNNFLNELYKGKRKRIVRWHSVDYIIEGILYLKKKFPTLGYFDIRDDTFSLRSLENIREFCDKYKKKVHMRFKCLADPKTTSNEKIKLLVDAGCTDIIIGIQGSERTNKEIYHRAQSDNEVLHAAHILNKYRGKLAVMYDVITCNPYEKPEDIVNLIRLLQKIPRPYYLSVNNLVFFTGSQLYQRAKNDNIIKNERDSAAELNYWDRSKHILLKGKNIYLNLIINLMRGPATENRFGFMPNFLLNYLLNNERIKKNLRNQQPSIIVTRLLGVYDIIRERILKPTYRSFPVSFKVWYDKIRYHA